MLADRNRSRRSFLKQAVSGLGLGLAAPYVLASRALGAPAPSDRVVTGHIGLGGLGAGWHLPAFMTQKDVQIAAVCDVDATHRDNAAKRAEDYYEGKAKVATYADFRELLDRKDIDGVIIATPDHWHTLPAVTACEAGKDVYCEKPLTLTLEEGKAMVRTARRYGTITQIGTQQRSDFHFRQVCEWVRNGRIGRVDVCRTWIGSNPQGKYEPPQTPPPNLDWNSWLGPAPWTDYVPSRCHGSFRWYRDYSGGLMTDWGVHLNDIVQWGMGTELTGPVRVEAEGELYEDNQFEFPRTMEVRYEFRNPDFTLFWMQPGNPDEPNRGYGIKFYGADGVIFVDRSGYQVYPEGRVLEPTKPGEIHLPASRGHQRNWLDSIKSRQPTINPWAIGHRSTTLSHLGNIAFFIGRPIHWDPEKEEITGDPEAARMASKPYRAPWRL